MTELYAEIIVPLATAPMTFSVAAEHRGIIDVGSRVMVNIGPRKIYSGVVLRLHSQPPTFKTKPIAKIIDPQRAVSAEQLRLWEWIAEYYMCPIGMVMRAAIPAKLKTGGFSLDEAVKGSFKPKTSPHVTLGGEFRSSQSVHQALDSLKRARAQHKALVNYLEIANLTDNFTAAPLVAQAELSASAAVIKSMTKSGIFAVEQVEAMSNAADTQYNHAENFPILTPQQEVIYGQLNGELCSKDVGLLFGVTGSGKTEIYIHFIAKALASGGNVLYMLPEISLTAQLIDRLEKHFGSALVIYHSRMGDSRRAEIYRSLLKSGGGRLIVGVRSSVLLPTPKLSLVIVDEEHDSSFKQSDSAPRYHGRDTAIFLASLYGAKTILGSATPSIETYFNAVAGKYALVTLSERYNDSSMPIFIVADIMRAAKRGEKTSHFTKTLLDHIDGAMGRAEQVILFQNRRGYSPFIECGSCGWTAVCPHCNVTLTYHKASASLRCHYCSHESPVVALCPACGHDDLQPRGFGTEKVEQELAKIYPNAVIDRLDADTASTMSGYQQVISRFERRETDILVGTQMITKGFDFEGVSVVGILNADNMLNFPDFRSSERAFSMMTQVGGRAGRRKDQGTVIIQTAQPDNPTIKQVVQGDYTTMAATALAERRSFLYPPYCRLICITLRHEDHTTVWQCAVELANGARPIFGRRLLGPEPPPVDRVRSKHLVRFMLKIERGRSSADAKIILQRIVSSVNSKKEFRNVDILIDVDPI